MWAKLGATNTTTEDDEDDEPAEATPVAKTAKSRVTKSKVTFEAGDDNIEEEAEDSAAQDPKPATKKKGTARTAVKKGVGKTTAPKKAAPIKKAAPTGKGRGNTVSKATKLAPRITPDLDIKYDEEDVEDETEHYQVEDEPQTLPADIEERANAEDTMSGVEEDNVPYDGGDEGESYILSNRYVSPPPDSGTVTVHNISVLYTEWDRHQARFHDMPLAAYVEWKLRNPYPFPDTPS